MSSSADDAPRVMTPPEARRLLARAAKACRAMPQDETLRARILAGEASPLELPFAGLLNLLAEALAVVGLDRPEHS